MVDMVNYGAAAQEYFGYQTGDLANANLTEEQKALATEAVTCGDDLIAGANYIGSTLNLKDRILMNVYFKNDGTVDVSKLYATVSFTGYKGNVEDHTVAVKSNKNGLYVEVDQIVLGDSFEPVTVTVYNEDGTVYGQVTDSVESYVDRNADNNALYMNIIKFAYSGREYMRNK